MGRWLPVGAVLALAIGSLQSQSPEAAYMPVAPAAAIHAALQANLKQYGDWVNDQDFASAGSTARGVIALANLYGYQGSEATWKKQISDLMTACNQLPAAAGQKDVAACRRAVDRCSQLLAELAKNPPKGGKEVQKSFKPPAATKTWMLLMDAAYADAKFAKTPQQLEELAFAIAEEVNAATYLRNDAAWRQHSLAVRQAALAVAQQSNDLVAAKKMLKEVYNRCEACHERYQKKNQSP